MDVTFITNDPAVKQAKFKAGGTPVAFVDGVLIVETATAEAVKQRTVYPIYGVHFHLRDGEEPLPAAEPGPTIRQGARSTESFKRERKH